VIDEPLRVTGLVIATDALEERFIRAGGPGGQHVNTTATAVQLRFDAREHLPANIYARLRSIAGQRMTDEGVVMIDARNHRSQLMNREDARERLIELLELAARPVKVRKATKPSRAAKRRRLDAKKQRGNLKQSRGKPGLE